MAHRELGMVEVREILRRWLGGEGVRAIARAVGVDRKTIGAYVQAAVPMGVRRGVPTPYLHQRVEVRADSRLVRVYHRGELIKVHALQPAGGRATDYTDYPAALTPYALRDPEACTRQAAQVGPAVEQFVRVLLRGVFPWARLRQAQKLLRLADRYGAARVNAACARALGFDLLDVGRVEGILRAALEREPAPTERGTIVALPARFARAPASFAIPIPQRRRPMSLEIAPDLLRRLKRLRLGGLVPTLPDRAAARAPGQAQPAWSFSSC